MFDLERANQNISDLCDYIERANAPNPENPAGLSDLTYHRVMAGLDFKLTIQEKGGKAL